MTPELRRDCRAGREERGKSPKAMKSKGGGLVGGVWGWGGGGGFTVEDDAGLVGEVDGDVEGLADPGVVEVA